MPTFTALTTLIGEDAANALAEAIEKLEPEPTAIMMTQPLTGWA